MGWVALAPTSSRACYAGVAESSVYIAESARGRGIGRALMEALIASADAGGIWTIQAGMFPENAASLALHERLGFRLVGRFDRIAQLDGVWRDTVLLERRAVSYAASSQRRNTTHALWPPKPNELDTPTSISCRRASFGM